MREHIVAGFVAVLIILCALPYILSIPSSDNRTASQLADSNSLFATVNGSQIHYKIYGDPINPPVILIHGLGGSTFTWRYTIPTLQENKYFVIALDLKGFGLSQKGLDIDYSHSSQAQMISDFMERLAIPQAIIVGHSMGANIATYLAMDHPEKVSKLILVDAEIKRPGFNLATQLSPIITAFPFSQYAKQIFTRYLSFDKQKDILKSAYFNPDNVSEDDVKGYNKAFQMKDWEDSLIGVIRDSNRNNLPRNLDTLDKPVRIIWGLQDPWINIEDGKRINVDIKGSIMDVVEESGHLPMEEKPNEFNAILLKDLK